MRRMRWTTRAGVGAGSWENEGTLADLVRDVPYLLSFGVIPPRHVLNAIFAVGAADSGMSGGCAWEPFEISSAEHEDLVRALVEGSAGRLRVDAAFDREPDMDAWLQAVCRERFKDDPAMADVFRKPNAS